MAGKQAKLLTVSMVRAMMKCVRGKRYPARDRVMILLSLKAGLRAGEIARLTWPMVLDAKGRVSHVLELHDAIAKKLHGRVIPLHPELRKALAALYTLRKAQDSDSIILSERGQPMENHPTV